MRVVLTEREREREVFEKQTRHDEISSIYNFLIYIGVYVCSERN